MKTLQALTLLTICSLACADKKPGKVSKAGKRDIAFGIQAVPGLAVHAPLADEGSILALGSTTGHGGFAVQPVQLIQHPPTAPAVFTSHGYDAFPSGYGVYSAPHAIVATPVLDVPGTVQKSVHQLDQGWKGIEYGHGSIKRGHEIAQSWSKAAIPSHDNVYEIASLASFSPQHDFEKVRLAPSIYNHNNLLATYQNYAPSAYGSINNGHASFAVNIPQRPLAPLHGTPAPKGYSFGTLHATPAPHHGFGPSGKSLTAHSTPLHASHNSPSKGNHVVSSHNSHKHGAHNSHQKFHTGHASSFGSTGHGSLHHAHQLAKNVRFPSGNGFTSTGGGKNVGIKHQSNHFTGQNSHHGKDHSTFRGHKKVAASSGKGNGSPAHSFSYSPSGPSKISLNSHSGERTNNFDSSTYSSYSSDFNSPQQKSFSSSEAHDSHGSGEKATSFQSFVIHNYKPHQSKHAASSLESGENFSGHNPSSELHF